MVAASVARQIHPSVQSPTNTVAIASNYIIFYPENSNMCRFNVELLGTCYSCRDYESLNETNIFINGESVKNLK
jgi:hypothetical protein